MKTIIKTRKFPESNYRAIYLDGRTIRFPIDSTLPIGELKYPEFLDVKITSKCLGKCPWCYMDSKPEDSHSINSLDKIEEFFGSMDSNQRPFQVAIGGGEPTSHPEFIDILKAFYELDICPNYTTNGMWIDNKNSNEILNATKKYCGGVAVSCRPHLKHYWTTSAQKYVDAGVKLNFHIIISDKESIDNFMEVYNQWKGKVDYFVLLPYGNQGRAVHKNIDWEYLVKTAPVDCTDLAFGANFHLYLSTNPERFDVSLYEPEIMSKFLDLMTMTVHKSSFNLNEI